MFFRPRTQRRAEGLPGLVAARAAGFTLIETCIAMVVMMVVGLGATSLFLFSIRNNSGGENRSQALAIAQQQLEELRSVGFNDPKLALGQTTSTAVLQNVTSGASGYGGGTSTSGMMAASSISGGGDDDTFKVVLEINGLPAGAAVPAQKRITITVSPENGHGANSWINQNPVVIIVHRSNPATGPYRQ